MYYDFINKKLDRKALRELNKKKVSHAKQPFSFTNRAKTVKLEFETGTLTDKEVKDIQEELQDVINKYFS